MRPAPVLSVTPDKFNLVPKVSEEYTLQLTNHLDAQRVVFKLFTTGHNNFIVRPKQGVLAPRQRLEVLVALRPNTAVSAPPGVATHSNFMIRFRPLDAAETVTEDGANIKELFAKVEPDTSLFYCTVHPPPSSMASASQPDFTAPPQSAAPAASVVRSAQSSASNRPEVSTTAAEASQPPPVVKPPKSAESAPLPAPAAAPSAAVAAPAAQPVAAASSSSSGGGSSGGSADEQLRALEAEVAAQRLRLLDAEQTIEQITLQRDTVAARRKRDEAEIAELRKRVTLEEVDGSAAAAAGTAASGSAPTEPPTKPGYSLKVLAVGVAFAFVTGLIV